MRHLLVFAVLAVLMNQQPSAQRSPLLAPEGSLSATPPSTLLACGTREQLIAALKSIAVDRDNGNLVVMVGYVGKDGDIHRLTAYDLEAAR